MKVVILSAGMGSRLNKNIPKSIVKLTDRLTILDLQINYLKKELNINLNDIYLVVGYKKDLIEKKYPNLNFVYNKDYKNTGTAKSLLKGLKSINNEDVIWINGDVVFESNILSLIKKNIENNLVCVRNDYTRKSELKYTINTEGYIDEISFNINNGIGEAIGINLIKKDNLKRFSCFLEKSEDFDYFDKALQRIIQENVDFLPLNIQDNFTIEIDYPNELEIAKKFVEMHL